MTYLVVQALFRRKRHFSVSNVHIPSALAGTGQSTQLVKFIAGLCISIEEAKGIVSSISVHRGFQKISNGNVSVVVELVRIE